jgi:hypothetical protein
MECIIRKVIEIELQPDNMNKEEVFPWASHGGLSLNPERTIEGPLYGKMTSSSLYQLSQELLFSGPHHFPPVGLTFKSFFFHPV